MPRAPDLSWQTKSAIWDLAAKLGSHKLSAIQTSLYRLSEESQWQEAIPDKRTIKAVIQELDSLSPSVLMTLPRHVREIRKDYPEIGTLLERIAGGGRIPRGEGSLLRQLCFGSVEVTAMTLFDHDTLDKRNRARLTGVLCGH